MGLNRRKFFGSLGGLLLAPLFVPKIKAKRKESEFQRTERLFKFLRTQPAHPTIWWEVPKKTFEELIPFMHSEFLLYNTVRNQYDSRVGIVIAGHAVYEAFDEFTNYTFKIDSKVNNPDGKFSLYAYSL